MVKGKHSRLGQSKCGDSSQPWYYSPWIRDKFLNPLDSQSHDLSCEQHSPLRGGSNEIMDIELKFTNIVCK